MRYYLLTALTSVSMLYCNETSQEQKPMRVDVRHIEAGGIGYDQGYTSFDLFLGHRVGNYFPFFDFRGHCFNDGKWAGNAGFGTRFLPNSWSTVLGMNVYYDYRRAYHTNFQQIGAGIEALRNRWEFRLNGYLPIGDKSSSYYDTKFGFFKGNHIYLRAKKHVTMAGGDAEVGYNFFPELKNYRFFTGIGPYYYHPECGKNAFGGRFRATASWKEYITLDLIETYDNLFHNNIQGQISLTYAFGPKSKNQKSRSRSLERRIVQPVMRDEIIVLSKCTSHPIAINPATGKPYFVTFVNNESHSLGTYESPYPTLMQAQNSSMPNTIIYVFPGDGTLTGLNSGIVLQEGQQLLGSSTSHLIPTNLGSIVIPPQTSALPPIIGSSTGNVVTLSSNNTVSGFYIQYLNGAGLTTTAPITNLTATQNIFQETGGNTAIDLSNNNVTGTVLIANNQFNAADISINIAPTNIENTTYSLVDNTFSTTNNFAVNLSYTDCSNIVTNFSGNLFSGGTNTCLSITVDNTSAPAQPHQFSIVNNIFNTSNINANILLSDFSNTTFSMISNSWFNINQAISCQVNDSSIASFEFNGNVVKGASSNNAPLVLVAGDTTQNVGFNASNNTLYSNNVGFSIGTPGNPIPLSSVSFDNNTMTCSYETILINYSTTEGPISLTNNTGITYINDPNVNGGSGAGFYINSSAGSNTPITLTNNYVLSNNYAITMNLANNDTGAISLTGNTMITCDTTPGLMLTSAGATPLNVSNNTVLSRGGGLVFNLNNQSPTSVSTTISGNSLETTGSQNALDVTIAGTAPTVIIANNTGSSLQNQGIALHLNGNATCSIVGNSFQAINQALYVETPSTSTFSLTVAQNNFTSLQNNTSDMEIYNNSIFTTVFQDNQFTTSPTSPALTVNISTNVNGDMSISDNTFIGGNNQLSITTNDTTTLSAEISNNLFSFSNNNTSLLLTSNNSTVTAWNIQQNSFTSFTSEAVNITNNNAAQACLNFTNNTAQPNPSAYNFTNTSSAPFTVGSLTGNIGQITQEGTTPGSCP